MLLSLRILISSLLGALVLGIAMLTFFLVFNVSVSSIRNLALTHAGQVALKAANEVASALATVEAPVASLQNKSTSAAFSNFTAPYDDPDGATVGCYRWLAEMQSIISTTQQLVFQMFMRFEDWSVAQCANRLLDASYIQDTLDCACAQSNLTYLAETGTEQFYNIITRQMNWTTGAVSSPPPIPPTLRFPNPVTQLATRPTAVLYKTAVEFGIGSPKGRGAFPAPLYARSPWGADVFVALNAAPMENLTQSGAPQTIGAMFPLFYLSFIATVLEASLTTPNSQAFLVDNKNNILGSTYGTWLTVHNATPAETVNHTYAPGCQADALGHPLTGCQATVSTLGFSPLAAAPTSVLQTPTLASTMVSASDGSNWLIGSAMVSAPLFLSYSSLNAVVAIPETDVDGDVYTQRDINLGVVFAAFVGASALGFFLVRGLLRPLDDVAERMHLAAQLKEESGKDIEASPIAEVDALQQAFSGMWSELMRLKGFVPHSLLLDADGANSSNGNLLRADDENADDDKRDGGDKRAPGSSTSDSGGALPAAANAASAAAALSVLARAGDTGTTASSLGSAHSLAMIKRLAVSASQLRPRQVAVAVINLRQFNQSLADLTPSMLVRLVDSLASKAYDVCANNRGALDSFLADHFIFTFNAARSCAAPMHVCASAALAFSEAIEGCGVVQRVRETVRRRVGSQSATSRLLTLSCGIALGPSIVGNLGSADAKRFSVVGDTMSRATELEGIIHLHPRAHQWRPQLPHHIAFARSDAKQLGVAMDFEFVDLRRLRFMGAAYLQQATESSGLVAIGRVLRERKSPQSSGNLDWLEASRSSTSAQSEERGANAGGASPMSARQRLDLRNIAFVKLERQEFDAYKALVAANPGLDHQDMEELLLEQQV